MQPPSHAGFVIVVEYTSGLLYLKFSLHYGHVWNFAFALHFSQLQTFWFWASRSFHEMVQAPLLSYCLYKYSPVLISCFTRWHLLAMCPGSKDYMNLQDGLQVIEVAGREIL